MVNKEELKLNIISALRNVYDPEIPISIWDLGLIYELNIDDEGNVKVKMTLTAPGCPIAYMIIEQVKEAISRVKGVKSVEVELVWEPPWTPQRMTKEGREIFKALFGYDIVEYWQQKYGNQK